MVSRIRGFSYFVIFVLLVVQQLRINGFEIGSTYKYSYETSVDVTNRLAFKNNSFKDLNDNGLLSVNNEITVDVFSFSGDDDNVNIGLRLKVSSDEHPILVKYNKESYSVKNIYYNSLESIETLNFKKGILSLLNLNVDTTEEISTVGHARNEFSNNESSNLFKIQKRKQDIIRKGTSFEDEYSQSDKTVDVSLNRRIESNYEIDQVSKLLKNVQSIENVEIFFELYKNSFRNLTSRQSLKFIEKTQLTLKIEMNKRDGNIVIGSEVYDKSSDDLMLSKPSRMQSNKSGKELEELGKQMKSLKKLKSGTRESCKKFLSLVKSLRDENINEKSLLRLGLKKYLKNDRIGSFLIDAFVAAQTPDALNTLLKELPLNKLTEKIDKKEVKLLEKFLISSSFVTHTTIKDIYKVLEQFLTLNSMYNLNLKDLAGLTVGSLVQTASLRHDNIQLVDQYYQLVKSELQNCKSEDCSAYFLNSIANSKLEKSITEIFEPEVERCSSKYNKNCILSLKTLRKFSPSRILTKNFTDNLLKIFYTQTNHSEISLLRLEALNILLHNDEIRNDSQMILNILLTIYDAEDYQFSLYAHKLVFSYINSSEKFKNMVESLISRFYHKHIQLKGASEVIRSDLFGSKTGQLSFDLKQLTSFPDEIIKSIDLSVNYENKITQRFLNILSFDVYTENLNTLMSAGSRTSGQKAQDPSAGLDLGILNKKIKKTEFFRGYTSLINAVWNAPTKLTTVFETNFLLNDQNEYIFLQNGLILQLNTIGALSIDVSALAEVSMWNQNANTLLQTNVALAIENSLKIYNSKKNEIISFNYEFDTSVRNDFHLNANFQQDPLKLCMKLLMNKINLKQTTKNSIENKQVKTNIVIQPLTFMLSKKAISLC